MGNEIYVSHEWIKRKVLKTQTLLEKNIELLIIQKSNISVNGDSIFLSKNEIEEFMFSQYIAEKEFAKAFFNLCSNMYKIGNKTLTPYSNPICKTNGYLISVNSELFIHYNQTERLNAFFRGK